MIKNTIKTIIAISVASSFTASASLSMSPRTTGNLDIGDGVNYTLSGEVNYLYGIKETKTGFQNSELGAKFATKDSSGVSSAFGFNVHSRYDEEDRKYEEVVTGDLSMSLSNSTINAGYDNWFEGTLFSSIYQSNLDTSFSQNPLGEYADDYNWFAEYSFIYKDLDLSFAVDEHKNFDITAAKYINNLQMDLSIFKQDGKLGGLISTTTDLSDSTLVTISAGAIDGEIMYTVAAAAILKYGFSTFGRFIGHQYLAETTMGIDYTYNNLTAYLEGAVEIGQQPNREEKLGAGIKLIF